MISRQTQLIDLACRSDANVLITGPTGSGKSTLAEEIHRRSARSSRPFVVINLATVHEGTIESELFGHERGAFTGADQRRLGRLELAQGGTVFLDEIGELPPRLQCRLLDFLQSRTVVPVGGNRVVHVDARVMAATHGNLERMVGEGRFREDLFHRLRVIPIRMPSLAERQEEFDGIVHGMLESICARHRKPILSIDEAAASMLESHQWPGNLRELANVLEYAVIASSAGVVRATDLPPWFDPFADEYRSTNCNKKEILPILGTIEMPLGLDYYETLSRFERLYLVAALRRFRGRVNLTARRVGINKTTLIRRMRAYQIGISKEYGLLELSDAESADEMMQPIEPSSGGPAPRSQKRLEKGVARPAGFA